MASKAFLIGIFVLFIGVSFYLLNLVAIAQICVLTGLAIFIVGVALAKGDSEPSK